MSSVSLPPGPRPVKLSPLTLVCGDPVYGVRLARLFRRTLGTIEVVSSLRELSSPQDLPLVAFYYDGLSARQRSEVTQIVHDRALRPTLLLMSNQCAQEDFARLFGAHAITNMLVVNESGVDSVDLLVTVQKILRAEPFGLEKYFGWGVMMRELVISGSHQRAEVLKRIGDHAASLGVASRLRTLITSAADEFLTNALYNAPVSPTGEHPFASRSRTTPVRLRAGSEVAVRFCCDGSRFGISFTDRFGSLTPSRVQDYLAKGFRRGDDQVTEGTGGAGLGLYQLMDSLSHFVINLEPGVRTEMIGLVDVRGSYRHFATAGTSFNIFVREPA